MISVADIPVPRPVAPHKRRQGHVLHEMRELLEVIATKGDNAVWPKTVAQYARMIGKSPRTIHRWIETGAMKATSRAGQELLVTQTDHEERARGTSRRTDRDRLLLR